MKDIENKKKKVEDTKKKDTATKTKAVPKKEVPKKKEKKTGKIIINTLTTILFIVIVLEAAIGIINMQKISNDEKPVWYLDKKITETELKTVTEYNLGLYKIIKTDTARETKTTLKPFFMN